MLFFTAVENKILIHTEAQRTPDTTRNPEQKKTEAGGVTVTNFKVYYRAISIKAPQYRHKKQICQSVK